MPGQGAWSEEHGAGSGEWGERRTEKGGRGKKQGAGNREHAELYLPCVSLRVAGRGERRTENAKHNETRNSKLKTQNSKPKTHNAKG